jgi:hypothetical protein
MPATPWQVRRAKEEPDMQTVKTKTPDCKADAPSTAPQVDPRLAFLIRAAVRFDLVELGEMGLDEAFDGLAPAFRSIKGVSA